MCRNVIEYCVICQQERETLLPCQSVYRNKTAPTMSCVSMNVYQFTYHDECVFGFEMDNLRMKKINDAYEDHVVILMMRRANLPIPSNYAGQFTDDESGRFTILIPTIDDNENPVTVAKKDEHGYLITYTGWSEQE
ncbi:hypothetical protein KC359_g8922 [Hortaea werneckii]|nr:hypothetical protein KC359_g8922 [Hortaea werneckii]